MAQAEISALQNVCDTQNSPIVKVRLHRQVLLRYYRCDFLLSSDVKELMNYKWSKGKSLLISLSNIIRDPPVSRTYECTCLPLHFSSFPNKHKTNEKTNSPISSTAETNLIPYQLWMGWKEKLWALWGTKYLDLPSPNILPIVQYHQLRSAETNLIPYQLWMGWEKNYGE